MDDDIHIAWGGGFDQPIFVGKEEAVRSTAAVEGSSVIHSGESESYQGEPSPRQEAPAARSRTRRASGSDEEAKKPSGPRRLRWHVSYGTPTARSASQRYGPQEVQLVQPSNTYTDCEALLSRKLAFVEACEAGRA